MRANRGAADPGRPAVQRCRLRAQPVVPAGGNLAGRTRGLRCAISESLAGSKPLTGSTASINTETLLARQPGFAESHYRLARLLNEPAPGPRPISTMSRPETWTVCRCAA